MRIVQRCMLINPGSNYDTAELELNILTYGEKPFQGWLIGKIKYVIKIMPVFFYLLFNCKKLAEQQSGGWAAQGHSTEKEATLNASHRNKQGIHGDYTHWSEPAATLCLMRAEHRTLRFIPTCEGERSAACRQTIEYIVMTSK